MPTGGTTYAVHDETSSFLFTFVPDTSILLAYWVTFLRFELLKTAVIALLGERGLRSMESESVEDLDLNLEPRVSGIW